MMVKLRLALVGENIEYSRSADIFATVFRQYGCEGEYEVCSVASSALERTVERLVESGAAGFSVTTPHKECVMSLLDEIDPVARTIGAVNCVALQRGRRLGYNTDWSGLAHALEPHAAILDGCAALVLGSGGAARATIYTLWKAFDVSEFVVSSRSAANVTSLKHHLEGMPGNISIVSAAAPADRLEGKYAVFNCTPLGGPNHPDRSPFTDGFDWSSMSLYCDLNYNNGNRLLAAARAANRPLVDGSRMLVAQALDAYEIWTGYRARFGEVYEAVFGSGDGV